MHRGRTFFWGLACVAGWLVATACSDSGSGADCDPGTERCECFGNSTCSPGLSCASGVCVDLGAVGGAPAVVATGGTTGLVPDGGTGATDPGSDPLAIACESICSITLSLGCVSDPTTETGCMAECLDPPYILGCDTEYQALQLCVWDEDLLDWACVVRPEVTGINSAGLLITTMDRASYEGANCGSRANNLAICKVDAIDATFEPSGEAGG